MITGEQIKAARALARMTQAQLADIAGISVETVKRLEAIRGRVSANILTVEAIVTAFDYAGISMIESDEFGGMGVRLKVIS